MAIYVKNQYFIRRPRARLDKHRAARRKNLDIANLFHLVPEDGPRAAHQENLNILD